MRSLHVLVGALASVITASAPRPNVVVGFAGVARDAAAERSEREAGPGAQRGAEPETLPEAPRPGDGTGDGVGDGHGEALDSSRRRAAVDALERGLAYLAAQQALQEDGSFSTKGTKEPVPVATAALACLAWMAGGSGPERGPHGSEVSRAVDYLLRNADLDLVSPERGYIAAPNAKGLMHAHGFATLALAEAFSISPESARGRRALEALEAAVRLIEGTQGFEGGWWYEPERRTSHENSITICLVQALRAAHNAGIQVDSRVIARAIDYVKRTQNEDGAFRYGLDHEHTSVGITAAAISTLNATGEYSSREISSGIEWIWRELAAHPDGVSATRFPYYERLYLAQALWQNPDPRLFERWYEPELTRVLTTQNEDGSWIDGTYGSCYATAMNCLVLAVPLGWLPIFQR